MSEQKEHINLFSAKDIQRYLKGELSPAEMHAIEKAALDDPFLADALEGLEETMSAHGEGVINTNLASIQQQVQDRVAKKNSNRVIVFRWWYAAAAAAVVLITGSLWLFNNGSLKRAPKENIAQLTAKNKANNDSPVVIERNSNAKADTIELADGQESASISKNVNTQKKYRKQASLGNKRFNSHINKDSSTYLVYKEGAGQAKAKADTSYYVAGYLSSSSAKREANVAELMKKLPGVEVDKSGTVTAQGEKMDTIETETIQLKARAKAVVSANQNDKTKLHNVISGKVMDQFSNPLSNASVLSLDDRIALSTDKYGLFRMPSNDSLVHVTVSVPGYTTQNFTLSNNAALNNIQLQPADANFDRSSSNAKPGLSEINVSRGYMNDFYSGKLDQQGAEPVKGWVQFEQYLINNRKPPTDTSTLKGQVVVSFIVNKKSGLSDFKVEQHLGKGYDEEAIRLIKEGPEWKLLKGKKAKVTVIVHF